MIQIPSLTQIRRCQHLVAAYVGQRGNGASSVSVLALDGVCPLRCAGVRYANQLSGLLPEDATAENPDPESECLDEHLSERCWAVTDILASAEDHEFMCPFHCENWKFCHFVEAGVSTQFHS